MKFRITPDGGIYTEDDFPEHNMQIDNGSSDEYDEVEVSGDGCSDVNCPVARLDSTGPRMGTNGGCSCFNHINNLHSKANVRSYLEDCVNINQGMREAGEKYSDFVADKIKNPPTDGSLPF